MPSSKKYSSLSQGPTHDVVPEKIYTVSNTGESKTDGIDTTEEEDYITVSKDELEKAYRFGKQVVKVSPEEEEYGKLKTKKELSILEFVPASTVDIFNIFLCMYFVLIYVYSFADTT